MPTAVADLIPMCLVPPVNFFVMCTGVLDIWGRGAVASFGGLGPIYKLQVPDKAAYPCSGFLHGLHNYVGRIKILCSSL